MKALLQQRLDQPFEVVIVDIEARAQELGERFQELPHVRVVASDSDSSYHMKNVGVAAARGGIVAMLDADCSPAPGWLAALVSALKSDRELVAVSGRTRYSGATALERAFGVLSRGYIDTGRSGDTHHISNNNAAFIREAFMAAPLPLGLGPFAAGRHAAAMRKLGRLWFEPAAVTFHAFEGIAMERDIRVNGGHMAITARRRDPTHKNAWLGRIGYAAIPLLAAGSALRGFGRIARLHREYELSHGDIVLAATLAVGMTPYEVEGMIKAIHGRSVTKTLYH